MTFANPTPLQVGATGSLEGRRYRVAGRVVMGMEQDGATYYWQEFNLLDGFGRSATLVFEETEDGPTWKLFKDFTPLRALSAAEAAAKNVGDEVNLDGKPAPITLVDESRVYHIDGTAPEGVEIGDVAEYFNVETDDRMLVVSWTGEDVEYYEGHTLLSGAVAAAFGFTVPPPAPVTRSFLGAGNFGGSDQPNSVMKLVTSVLVAAMLFGFYSCRGGWFQSSSVTGPPPKKAAPAQRLASGAHGQLTGHEYTVASHAVVEVARVAGRHERHEYWLAGAQPALLLHGLSGNPQEWHLFESTGAERPAMASDPYAAATRRKGSAVQLGSRSYTITDLFQSKLQARDGDAAEVWDPLAYGFIAQQGSDCLMARWTEAGIRVHVGHSVPQADVLAAFGAAKAKP